MLCRVQEQVAHLVSSPGMLALCSSALPLGQPALRARLGPWVLQGRDCYAIQLYFIKLFGQSLHATLNVDRPTLSRRQRRLRFAPARCHLGSQRSGSGLGPGFLRSKSLELLDEQCGGAIGPPCLVASYACAWPQRAATWAASAQGPAWALGSPGQSPWAGVASSFSAAWALAGLSPWAVQLLSAWLKCLQATVLSI